MTRRMKRKFWTWFWRLAALITVALLISVNGNQLGIMIMNTDILNTLNDMRIEQNAPETESQSMDPVSSISLTPEERELAFRVVMSESGDEDLQAQMAAAQTLYDRMNDFGDTLQEAIKNGVYSQKDNGDPTDSVKLAVANVFDGGMRVYEGGTYQFHDDTVSPDWAKGKIKRGTIGRLTFYGGYEQ